MKLPFSNLGKGKEIAPWALSFGVALLGLVAFVNTPQADETCKPEVKARIQKDLEPTPEMLAQGAQSFALNCASCHGDKGLSDGPAGQVLNPKPRNFVTDEFVRGTSVLGIYQNLTLGLNAGMPAFENLPEAERLALAHHVRALMPAAKRLQVTPEQIEETCIEMSNPKLPAIPIDLAMDLLVEEADVARRQGRPKLGPIKLNDAGDEAEGQLLFGERCASCHGPDGQGIQNYARAGRFPFIEMTTLPLEKIGAAGAWTEFADRAAFGVHSTLPDVTGVALLSDQEWKSLQTFVAKKLPGDAVITSDTPPPAPKAALLSVGEGYNLVWLDGKAFKLTTSPPATPDITEAPLAEITSYDDFKKLYKGTSVLPETAPGDVLTVEGVTGMDCIGRRAKTPEGTFGCPNMGDTALAKTNLVVKFSPPAVPDPNAPKNP